jgi:hypothetical protein
VAKSLIIHASSGGDPAVAGEYIAGLESEIKEKVKH